MCPEPGSVLPVPHVPIPHLHVGLCLQAHTGLQQTRPGSALTGGPVSSWSLIRAVCLAIDWHWQEQLLGMISEAEPQKGLPSLGFPLSDPL